jgi:hypothetical protein
VGRLTPVLAEGLVREPPKRLPANRVDMGMAAHAVVVKEGAAVFIHLHPFGTISMAAQQQLAGDPTAPHTAHDELTNTVEFPYAFPEAGRYFIWVQVKRAGQILTGVFETNVSPSPR